MKKNILYLILFIIEYNLYSISPDENNKNRLNNNKIFNNNCFILGSFTTDSNGNITNQSGNLFYVYYDDYYTIYDTNSGEALVQGDYMVTFLQPFCAPVAIAISCSKLTDETNPDVNPSLAMPNNFNSLNGELFTINNVPTNSTITFLATPIL